MNNLKNLMVKPKNLKKSFYNFYLPKEDGSYLVYNSITGAIIHIHSQDKIDKLVQIIENTDNLTIEDDEDEMINLFYDKGLLIDADKDEYKFIRYCHERDVIRDNTLALTLVVTRQCNLRCIYCYEEHENKFMSSDLYESIIKFIDTSLTNKAYTGVTIGLFGGEPFLEYDNIINFLEKVQEICQNNHVPFYASATTNGVLIYPERFEKLVKAGCKHYQITIDGLAETHDKYRVSVNGKGSWNTIISNLKYMSSTDYDFNVTVRTNFNNEVFEKAEEFYQYIKDNLDSRFSTYYEGIKKLGGSNDDNLDILDKNDVADSSVNIAKKIKELNLNNDVVDHMTRPYSRICYASKHNNYLIDYDGSILKCTLALDDPINKVGYIEDGEFFIDGNKHSKWVGAKIDLNDECKKCKVLPICFGGRCISGRVKGDLYECSAKAEELELSKLINTFK